MASRLTALKKVRGNSSASRGRMTTAPPENRVGKSVPNDPSKWNGDTHRVRVSAVEPSAVRRSRHGGGEGPVADQHPLGRAGGPRGVDGVGDPGRGRRSGAGRSARRRAQLRDADRRGSGPGRGTPSIGLRLVVRGDHHRRCAVGHDGRPAWPPGSVTASGTKMAPIHRQARAATTKSTELGRWRATRRPPSRPGRSSPAATWAASSTSSRVGQLPVQVLDRRPVGPGRPRDRRWRQGRRARSTPVPGRDGLGAADQRPGSSPVGTPSSKVTAPRLTVHR